MLLTGVRAPWPNTREPMRLRMPAYYGTRVVCAESGQHAARKLHSITHTGRAYQAGRHGAHGQCSGSERCDFQAQCPQDAGAPVGALIAKRLRYYFMQRDGVGA